MSPSLAWESSNDHKHIYAKRWLREKKTLSPFRELYGPYLFKVESPSPSPKMLCTIIVWLLMALWLWRRRILTLVNEFLHCHYYLPFGKDCGPSFEQTWSTLIHPMMLCAKFGWNWPSGSGEEEETRKS